jgi:hypothetical protein
VAGELTSLMSGDGELAGAEMPRVVTVDRRCEVESDAAADDDDDAWGGEDLNEGSPVSVHQRIEELRLMLEHAMGLERFRTAYQCMKEAGVSDDEQLLSEKIAEVMGEGFQDLFPSLVQLIVCEMKVYDACNP